MLGSRKIVSLTTPDSPDPLRALKYTLRLPTPKESRKFGAVPYAAHEAPEKVGDSLAIYCVGDPKHVLFNVAPSDIVVATPLLIANDVTTGGGTTKLAVTVRSAVTFVSVRAAVSTPSLHWENT